MSFNNHIPFKPRFIFIQEGTEHAHHIFGKKSVNEFFNTFFSYHGLSEFHDKMYDLLIGHFKHAPEDLRGHKLTHFSLESYYRYRGEPKHINKCYACNVIMFDGSGTERVVIAKEYGIDDPKCPEMIVVYECKPCYEKAIQTE